MKKSRKPWGGRFSAPTDRQVEEFTSSLTFDRRLYRHDIAGSIAHCRMLERIGAISREEADKIVAGLEGIRRDIEAGRLLFSPELEDIHMAVESALVERIGPAGGKLHSGRSRNDQVALDLRLYLREETARIISLLERLKDAFLDTARSELDTILPGYTHLQKAQPVLLSHYLLAYWEMLDRDEARFRECLGRINVLPLGAAALAGSSLPLDRKYVAKILEFPRISGNSMDAVSDRDFAAEFLFAASLCMMHMSRFCEDLIIWSSGEFSFIEISDAFTTGSSLMPQKKNPDVAEMVRGKTGRVYGNLICLLTVLKGLPMSYNRDLQEDKEPVFDTVDTLAGCLGVIGSMLDGIKFNRERMLEEAARGFSTATEIADYLVMKGVPFRTAHGIVGGIVGECVRSGKTLADLRLEDWRRYHSSFENDVFSRLDAKSSIMSKTVEGGTGRKQVKKRVEALERLRSKRRKADR
ncbi:MAG TPA: argininosuccinate lyase [Syntrophales bacterium]|nr:argininosuccinate lyase [Syntrophales bacterium]